jgi:hypothetical protein
MQFNLLIRIIKKTFIIILITFFLTLSIDYFFGKFILNKLEPFLLKTEFYQRFLAVKHPIYHHDLRASVDYKYANTFRGTYRHCTNNYGFKDKCGSKGKKNYDLAFIGDSFVESAIEHEKTIPGIFESKSKLSIVNLGVITYSPKIYLSKINYLLENGFKFKHVIIFIDISDFWDDSNWYSIDNNFVVKDKDYKEKNLELRDTLREKFPLTNFYFFLIKRIDFLKTKGTEENTFPIFLDKVEMKAKWTYNKEEKIKDYDLTQSEGAAEMKATMEKLYIILKKNKIKMSIAVYPWPQQLLKDKKDSLHVKMWRDFCIGRCSNFINMFPVFFDEMEKTSFLDVYKKYYYWNDVHFNQKGNELIANYLIKNFSY